VDRWEGNLPKVAIERCGGLNLRRGLAVGVLSSGGVAVVALPGAESVSVASLSWSGGVGLTLLFRVSLALVSVLILGGADIGLVLVSGGGRGGKRLDAVARAAAMSAERDLNV
jgi:hypothetical protein